MDEQFKRKFKIDELTLIEFSYWILSLRPHQPTLGSLILSLKRGCQHLGHLKTEETGELSKIFYRIEKGIHDMFKNDKINYLALMMLDHHVHFHVIPRYAGPRIFELVEFKDTEWPKPPNVLTNSCDDITLQKLFLHMKTKFNETYS